MSRFGEIPPPSGYGWKDKPNHACAVDLEQWLARVDAHVSSTPEIIAEISTLSMKPLN